MLVLTTLLLLSTTTGIPGESADPFETWLEGADIAADGFSSPVALPDAWTVEARGEAGGRDAEDGERWSRPGSGSAYALASARGRVHSVVGDEVVVAHVVYENHRRLEVIARYSGITRPTVRAGQTVARGQTVGVVSSAPPSFTLRLSGAALHEDETPRHFIARMPSALPPLDEDVLVLVHHDSYRMQLFEGGVRTADLRVGFGQAKGRKRVQGDLKSPKGMYFVTGKHRGTFSGRWAAYYGGHWIKLSYPNAFDAAWGHEQGWLSEKQRAAIAASWIRRELPAQNTRLGGGIGFHGWIEEWDDDTPHLSWGCMVVHLRDVSDFWERVPEGAMVVLF